MSQVTSVFVIEIEKNLFAIIIAAHKELGICTHNRCCSYLRLYPLLPLSVSTAAVSVQTNGF